MTFSNKIDLSGIGLPIEQEILVLKRYVLYSIAITFFYALLTIRNIVLKSNPEDTVSLIVTLAISGIFSIYFVISNRVIAKNYITLVFSFTTIFSFFSFNGITVLFTIDFINVIIFTFILFNEKSLIK